MLPGRVGAANAAAGVRATYAAAIVKFAADGAAAANAFTANCARMAAGHVDAGTGRGTHPPSLSHSLSRSLAVRQLVDFTFN